MEVIISICFKKIFYPTIYTLSLVKKKILTWSDFTFPTCHWPFKPNYEKVFTMRTQHLEELMHHLKGGLVHFLPAGAVSLN